MTQSQTCAHPPTHTPPKPCPLACFLQHRPLSPLVPQGRDASRNLARAIEAGKMREALPARIARVAAALAEWREAEGAPFLYDGRDYEVGPWGCGGVCMCVCVCGRVRVRQGAEGVCTQCRCAGQGREACQHAVMATAIRLLSLVVNTKQQACLARITGKHHGLVSGTPGPSLCLMAAFSGMK